MYKSIAENSKFCCQKSNIVYNIHSSEWKRVNERGFSMMPNQK